MYIVRRRPRGVAALERGDVCVVHARWHDQHMAALRGLTGSVVEHSKRFASEIERRLCDQGIVDRARDEGRVDLTDPDSPPPMLSALAERNVRQQIEHPIKMLTSGLEAVADAPFFASARGASKSASPTACPKPRPSSSQVDPRAHSYLPLMAIRIPVSVTVSW